MKYMGSKSRIAKDLLPILTKKLTKDRWYVEPFCLSGETLVFAKNGVKSVKDLQIGDYIIDEFGEYTKVVNKIEKDNIEKGLSISIKGGINIKCSLNHPFYDKDNKELLAKDLKIGDSLLMGVDSNKNDIVIDMANYITITKNKRFGRNGSYGEDWVKLYHNAPKIKRFIEVDKDFCQCLGLVISEGDKSNITMNISEREYLEDFLRKYEKITGLKFNNKCFYEKEDKNSIEFAVPCKTIYERLFFTATNLKSGARCKNISFLFSLNRELCLEVIRYMIIGDGSCSENGVYRNLNYKTSSRNIANQLQALLAIKFGIKSTIHHGVNKERYIKGRLLPKSDYYNVGITHNEDITFILGEKNANIVINEKKKGYVVKCIEQIEEKFYDITIDNKTHRYIINGGIVTHNCGGCNMMDKVNHPKRLSSDSNNYLIAMWKLLLGGYEFPQEISKQVYDFWRNKFNKRGFNGLGDTLEEAMIGWVGFMGSFNGRFFDGGYSGHDVKGRDYIGEQMRNTMSQIDTLKGVVFMCGSYDTLEIPKNSVIYCDIPYKNTKQYSTSKGFDHDAFWEWCRNKTKEGNDVLISEYQAPDDFVCVWQKQVTNAMNTKNTYKPTEKLFVHETISDKYITN